MRLPLYQVDAFSDKFFGGNPAAVVPLPSWLDDALLQAIAAENNLSETAFFVPQDQGYALRWFTPKAEIDLCGHATLATGKVLLDELGLDVDELVFYTRSGELRVRRDTQGFSLSLPTQLAQPCTAPAVLLEAMGVHPQYCFAGTNYMLVYDTQAQIEALQPDMALLRTLDRHAVMATAPGADVDFVLRFFAPKFGIDEDPVTGSAFCALVPYWSQRLGKQAMQARQLSQRGGAVQCRHEGEAVRLIGQVAPYLSGHIEI